MVFAGWSILPGKNNMKKIIASILSLSALLPGIALAHSTVTPSQTVPSKYENFSVSVPTEKDVPTVGVRLVMPDGVDRFSPFVKPGWKINVTKDVADKVTQVEWTGGTIPAGQKDVFLFTARTAPEDTTLIWKVYQTYQDGEIVAWDQPPSSSGEVKTPYSVTEVKATTASSTESSTKTQDRLPLVISIVALVIAFLAWRSKNGA